MDMQFNNCEDLTTDELHVQRKLRRFWKRFGSGTFRTTRNCAHCQDELIEYPEFTELIVPVDENHNNLETILFNDSSNRNDDDVWRCDTCTASARPIKTRCIHDHLVVLCILVNRVFFNRETITYHRQDTKFAFPIVNFNPNNNLHCDVEMYDLIGGIFHHSANTNDTGHYTVVCVCVLTRPPGEVEHWPLLHNNAGWHSLPSP
jgi:ubiquitin C-terminal hydrolase